MRTIRNVNHKKRPVLIIDGGSRGDIGVIRSLGFGCVPVQLLATNPRSPSVASRYVQQVHPFPGLGASDEVCLAAIRTATRKMKDRPVMLATGDRALSLMSRLRTELAEILDHDLAPACVIESCLDKSRFAPMAQSLGIPIPETFVPENFAEARVLATRLSYPVFVKPVHRADWRGLPPDIVHSVKGERFGSCEELLHLLDELETRKTPHFVVQSFVEGGDHAHMSVHAYIFPDGKIAGTFTGSKLRIYPPHAGVGAQVLSRRMPEPEALARRVLKALGYTGFAILQFKQNVRSGAYDLLEINCRYSTWTELPSRAGCNFPLAAYATLVGQPLPRLEQREGLSWLDMERDLLGMKDYRAAGEWTWTAYARSLKSVRCWAYFAWDDPGPFFRKVLSR